MRKTQKETYKYLTLGERIEIYALSQQGGSLRGISKKLVKEKWSPETIAGRIETDKPGLSIQIGKTRTGKIIRICRLCSNFFESTSLV